MKLKFSSPVTKSVFQVLSKYVWLVATLKDNADIERVHHCRKFYG